MVEAIAFVRVSEVLAQNIGTGARSILLIAGGHIAGAHRTARKVRAAAFACSVALFGQAQNPQILLEAQGSFYGYFLLPGLIAQVAIHRGRIYNFVGIEDIVGVEGIFDAAQQLVVFRANHKWDKLRPEPPVAVLATQRALVFFYEQGSLFGHLAEEAMPFGSFEVDDRAQMQLAASGMSVVYGVKAVFVQHFIEFGNIGRQLLYIHGCIFYHTYRFGIAGDIGQQPQAGIAQRPHFGNVLALEDRIMMPQAFGF